MQAKVAKASDGTPRVATFSTVLFKTLQPCRFSQRGKASWFCRSRSKSTSRGSKRSADVCVAITIKCPTLPYLMNEVLVGLKRLTEALATVGFIGPPHIWNIFGVSDRSQDLLNKVTSLSGVFDKPWTLYSLRILQRASKPTWSKSGATCMVKSCPLLRKSQCLMVMCTVILDLLRFVEIISSSSSMSSKATSAEIKFGVPFESFTYMPASSLSSECQAFILLSLRQVGATSKPSAFH
mmetsp:Transcript_39034/g.90181  ORF Transcript_39034/g.90181 Transcript_39034/m.90181 type:complete len:238 (+) Transcript_39034:1338-2051(+)